MKKFSLFIVFIFISSLSYSQSQTEELEIFQNIFGKEKKAAFASVIKIEDATKKEAFWRLYDAYEVERKDLGKERISTLSEYAQNYDNLSDEKIDEIFNKSIKINNGLNKLLVSYYKKIKKEVDTKTAAQFAQVENYFLAAIRYEISSQIPFIEDIKE